MPQIEIFCRLLGDSGGSTRAFAFLIMFVGIIRSFWVAIKLWNVYNNNEKYALNPTELKNPNKTKGNNNYSIIFSCCLCVIIIFLIFAISAIL